MVSRRDLTLFVVGSGGAGLCRLVCMLNLLKKRTAMNEKEKMIEQVADLIAKSILKEKEGDSLNANLLGFQAEALMETHNITVVEAATVLRARKAAEVVPEPEIETTLGNSVFPMNELPFKSFDAALEYVEEFFKADQLKPDKTFYGKIVMEDNKSSPSVFMVEIVVLEKKLFSKSLKRLLVAGVQHEELPNKLEKDDLVIWGCLDTTLKIPAGVVIHKLQPVLNIQTGQFNFAEEGDDN